MSYHPEEDVNKDIASSNEENERNSEAEETFEEENELYSEKEDTFEEENELNHEAVDTFEIVEPYYDSSEVAQERTKRSNKKGIIFDLIFYAILIFVCIYVIPNYVLQRTVVDGASMENTLSNGDQLYVEKVSYHFDALKRYDIIVFYPYGKENEDYYVKRIIGLPGETIQIIGSDIYIDGEILTENYGKDPIVDQGRAAELITLKDDEYFVLGDNRTISKDSRTEEVGNVKQENIGGRVIIRIKPLNKFGTVD